MFTINNYSDIHVTDLVKQDGFKYILYGKEIAPKTGTPHLQGFVYFKDGKTLSATKKWLGGKAHLEVRKGTFKQIIDYCKKDGDFVEAGKEPVDPLEKGSNEKKRYQRAWELAKEGNLDEIDPDIRLRLYGTLKKIHGDYQPKPQSMEVMDFHWYYGDSGAGKSRRAREENPDHYLKGCNKWWDGYNGEHCVIIDEWEPCHACLGNHLKRWCDHHPFDSEAKGSRRMLRPPKIIVTSNYSIEECFPEVKGAALAALLRRFKVTHFELPGGNPLE